MNVKLAAGVCRLEWEENSHCAPRVVGAEEDRVWEMWCEGGSGVEWIVIRTATGLLCFVCVYQRLSLQNNPAALQ